ncbi:hypothetical protein HNO53_05260 [Billgrantia antri]|uniref:Uncharacterized protein n=1 Tax=Halomonas sulfidivorans TaxID=2733488 RepID=A0ABX7WFD1_9GAMM|nr:hypothetical protein [Halomonas sulfidivorans]QTP58177.1 hypothetical protein HNO53_05260 [Halomonas sulfidivorans]
MALKSLLARAVAAGKQAHRQNQQDGWSDGWQTKASTAESLRVLSDSAAGAAKSTARTATTPEGWRRIARGAGKVVGGAAVVAGGVAQGVLQAADSEEKEDQVERQNGWRDGHAGYGYYYGGWRMDDEV